MRIVPDSPPFKDICLGLDSHVAHLNVANISKVSPDMVRGVMKDTFVNGSRRSFPPVHAKQPRYVGYCSWTDIFARNLFDDRACPVLTVVGPKLIFRVANTDLLS
jgi:hypothetical protein